MKKCEVCEQAQSKYRCPTCRLLYCSVGCYKMHKENLCQQTKPSQETVENVIVNSNSVIEDLCDDDRDKVAQEKFSLLESSQTIKDMLTNKHLQDILKSIDMQKNGEKELDAAMKLPLFVEFANECLKLVDDRMDETP